MVGGTGSGTGSGVAAAEKFVQQIISTKINHRQPDEEEDQHMEADGDLFMPSSNRIGADETPLGLVAAFRLWTLLMNCPSRAIARQVVYRIWSAQLVRQLVRLALSGHPLAWIAWRTITMMGLHEQTIGVIIISQHDATATASNQESDDMTVVQSLHGLLRLSSAPLLTRELILFLSEATGCAASRYEDECAAAEEVRRNTTREDGRIGHTYSAPTTPPIDAISTATRALYSSHVHRSAGSVAFIAAFLAPSGRSILLLTKHLTSPDLNAFTRRHLLSLLDRLTNFIPPPPPHPSSSSSPSLSPAIRLLPHLTAAARNILRTSGKIEQVEDARKGSRDRTRTRHHQDGMSQSNLHPRQTVSQR